MLVLSSYIILLLAAVACTEWTKNCSLSCGQGVQVCSACGCFTCAVCTYVGGCLFTVYV